MPLDGSVGVFPVKISRGRKILPTKGALSSSSGLGDGSERKTVVFLVCLFVSASFLSLLMRTRAPCFC